MARVRLQSGFECDILSGAEHKADMEELEARLVGYLEDTEGDTQGFVNPSTFTTDASGNGSGTAYVVPQGYRAYLLRLAVDYEGSSAKTPTSCDVRIVADQNTPLALKSLNNTLPSVFSEARSHAALFQPGQHVVVSITGGPATTIIYCSGQVLLVPVRKRVPIDVQAPAAPVVQGSAVGAS